MESLERGRPPHTESYLASTQCFRFHKARYFKDRPVDFYRNFLETRRTFKAQQRFAGPGFNTGFYFAATRESALAEIAFYEHFDPACASRDPLEILEELGKRGDERVFLEVTLSMQRIADLTDPVVLEYFLREGPARASFTPSGVPYSILRTITPPDRGGSRHTDGIGHFASSNGWAGIKFPSVRALSQAWGIERLTRLDLLGKTLDDAPAAFEPSVEDQLRNQAILVLFSGSLLTRSITCYSWTDASGSTRTAENPYSEYTAAELEEVRTRYRDRNGLSPVQAAELGFLSDAEIAEEFAPHELWWVAKKERL